MSRHGRSLCGHALRQVDEARKWAIGDWWCDGKRHDGDRLYERATAILAMFPTETVNRAMLQSGLSTDPFPDLGKLVAACQHIESERNPQVVRGEVSAGQPGSGLVNAAAQALGLEV